MADDPYSRLYWRFADEFPAVYESDTAYALWCRLLRLADMAWPANATLPIGTRKATLAVLVEHELVLLVTPSTYRIRGMAKERTRRTEAGRIAGLASAAARRAVNDPSNDRPTDRPRSVNLEEKSRDETSRDETRQDETSIAPADDPVDALYVRTGRYPVGKIKDWATDLGERHGDRRVADLIRSTSMSGSDVRAYLLAITDTLRSTEHAAERAELADEKARLAEKRAKPTPIRPAPVEQTPEEAEAELRAYLAETGGATA